MAVALLVTSVTAVIGVVDATPVDAAANPCYWLAGRFGDESNCDGLTQLAAIRLGCSLDTEARAVDIGRGIRVSLWYSSNCRLVYAQMYTVTPPPAGSSCYVKVVRNSDGARLASGVGEPGLDPFIARTKTLFDAGVSSYAWGSCRWGPEGSPLYKGGTSSF